MLFSYVSDTVVPLTTPPMCAGAPPSDKFGVRGLGIVNFLQKQVFILYLCTTAYTVPVGYDIGQQEIIEVGGANDLCSPGSNR